MRLPQRIKAMDSLAYTYIYLPPSVWIRYVYGSASLSRSRSRSRSLSLSLAASDGATTTAGKRPCAGAAVPAIPPVASVASQPKKPVNPKTPAAQGVFRGVFDLQHLQQVPPATCVSQVCLTSNQNAPCVAGVSCWCTCVAGVAGASCSCAGALVLLVTCVAGVAGVRCCCAATRSLSSVLNCLCVSCVSGCVAERKRGSERESLSRHQ